MLSWLLPVESSRLSDVLGLGRRVAGEAAGGVDIATSTSDGLVWKSMLW